MKLSRRLCQFILGGLALMVFSVSGVAAATLNVIDGQLLGASGVYIGGSRYDVNFVDGTCIDLFAGCDDGGDFDFNTPWQGHDAAQALIDQVFVDGPAGMFNSNPELTVGCEGSSTICRIIIPHTIVSGTALFLSALTRNNDEGAGAVGWAYIPNDFDTSIYDIKTFAQFTQTLSGVPLPSAFWLFGTVLLGLVGIKKRGTKATG